MTTNIVKESRRQKLIELLIEYGVWGPGFEDLVERLSNETDFFTAPASTKWHAAYPGGLFDHCVGVMQQLVELTHKGVCSPWQRSVSPFIVGLLHDATKFGAYIMKQDRNPLTQEIETWYEWNPEHEELSPIHGEDSRLKVHCRLLELTDEEQACIRWHMGAYEGKDSWPGYDAAIRKYPNVLWTHTADMYASKVMEERNAE